MIVFSVPALVGFVLAVLALILVPWITITKIRATRRQRAHNQSLAASGQAQASPPSADAPAEPPRPPQLPYGMG